MKKLLGLIVMIIMAVSAVSASADTVEPTYEAELLSALGIDVSKINPEEEVTRSIAAKIFLDIAGAEATETENIFFDVPENHQSAAVIATINNLDIMHGTQNGLFEPDRTITYAEMVSIIAGMMNYDVYAEANGSFPTGYIKVADRLKLSKHTGGLAADTKMTGKTFLRVIYNALDKEVLKVKSFGENVEYETVPGETFSYEYFGVVKGEGRVNATEYTAILGDKVGKGRIRIGDDIIEDKNNIGAGFIAMSVEYWMTVSDGDSSSMLVYIMPDGEEEIISIKGYDIIGVNDNGIDFYEGEKEEDISFSDDMVVIVNGDMIDYTKDDIKPADGTVKFIINKQNKATAAIVNNYTYGIVRGVSTAGNKIIFDNSTTLELDGFDDYAIIKNGKNAELIELSAGDVLNVQISNDKKRATIEVSGAKLAGKVTGIEEIRGRNVFSLEGVEEVYTISPSYADFTKDIRLSFEGEWYTNIMGDVISCVKLMSGSMEYGYMAAWSYINEDSEAVRLKIFTKDGVFIRAYTKEKVIVADAVDGSTKKLDATEFEEYLRTWNIGPQLVKYMTDEEGYLKKIQFSKLNYDRASGENLVPVGEYGAVGFTLDYITDAGTTGYYQVGIFDCRFFVNPNAYVFRVPADKNEEEEYSVILRSSLPRRVYYAAELYDVNENFEAQAAVINLAGETADYDWATLRIALIDKNIKSYIEAEDETAVALNIYQDGKAGVIYCTDDKKATQTSVQSRYKNVYIKDLKPGDVIAYNADGAGYIRSFELLYSPSLEDGSYFEYANETGMPNKYDYASELYLCYGEVKGASGNGLVVNASKDGKDNTLNRYFLLEQKLTRTFMFDKQNKSWKAVPFTSIIKGNKVVVRMMGYGLWEVLIYE